MLRDFTVCSRCVHPAKRPCRQLYELFLNRARETGATSDLQTTVARVIDPAVVPGSPVKPQKGLLITISLMLGLMLGIILALLLEYLDNTVRSSEDVATKLGAPMQRPTKWRRARSRK